MLGIDLNLSLARQAMIAHHRHRAAHMDRNELAQLADELIQRCHQQEHLITELQKAAANLMVQLALHDEKPFGAPSEEHHRWAKELLDAS